MTGFIFILFGVFLAFFQQNGAGWFFIILGALTSLFEFYVPQSTSEYIGEVVIRTTIAIVPLIVTIVGIFLIVSSFYSGSYDYIQGIIITAVGIVFTSVVWSEYR